MSNVEKKLQSSTQSGGVATPTGAKTEYPEMFFRFFQQNETFQTDNLLNAYKNDMKRCIIDIATVIAKQMFMEKELTAVLLSIQTTVTLCYNDLAELEKENLEHCFCGKGGVICD